MPRSSPTNPRLVRVCFHVTEYEVLQYILVDFTTVVMPFKKYIYLQFLEYHEIPWIMSIPVVQTFTFALI